MATREPFTYRFKKYDEPIYGFGVADEEATTPVANNMAGYSRYLARVNTEVNRAMYDQMKKEAEKEAEKEALMESLTEDTKSYGNYYDDYANAMNRNKEFTDHVEPLKEKIANNEARIAELNARNDEIKAKEYEDPNDRLARIEMLKIGEPGQVHDATSFWRWNENRKDAKAARAEQLAIIAAEKDRLKAKAISDFNNKQANFLTNPRPYNSQAGKNQYLTNLNSLITEGQNLEADVSNLINTRTAVLGSAGEQVNEVTGSSKDSNTVMDELTKLRNYIDSNYTAVGKYDSRGANKVKKFNNVIVEYNTMRDEAIKNYPNSIFAADFPLIKSVSVPLPPYKSPDEIKEEKGKELDNKINNALHSVPMLKRLLNNVTLNNEQKGKLLEWINSQSGQIRATPLSNEINKIIENGGKK